MDALGRMALLTRRRAVGQQPRVDYRPIRAELRRRPRHRQPLDRRQRRLQRLTHRPPMHAMTLSQRPDRQALTLTIPSNLLELLHPGSHSPAFRSALKIERQPSSHDRTEVGALQAIAVGPVQTIVLSTRTSARPSAGDEALVPRDRGTLRPTVALPRCMDGDSGGARIAATREKRASSPARLALVAGTADPGRHGFGVSKQRRNDGSVRTGVWR